jgi:hypothetical protein
MEFHSFWKAVSSRNRLDSKQRAASMSVRQLFSSSFPGGCPRWNPYRFVILPEIEPGLIKNREVMNIVSLQVWDSAQQLRCHLEPNDTLTVTQLIRSEAKMASRKRGRTDHLMADGPLWKENDSSNFPNLRKWQFFQSLDNREVNFRESV